MAPGDRAHSRAVGHARGLKLYSSNPTVVAKFREAYPDLGKGDWVDAMVIADRLRFGWLLAECYLDERYQPGRFTGPNRVRR